MEQEETENIQDFNVYCGAETGLLKGIHLNQKAVIKKNVHTVKNVDRQYEITSMAWGNEDQTEVLVGCRNKTVQVFDSDDKEYVSARQLENGEGPIVSLARWKGVTVTAVKSGEVTIWTDGEKPTIINALQKGEHLEKMRQSRISPNVLATGGKENDLQLWDLNNSEQPIFRARNVAPDMLDLRVPIWVSDIAYMDDQRTIGVSTRHRQIRLYDPHCRRRPVKDFEWGEYALSSISAVPSNIRQVVVGSSDGRMGLFDLRRKTTEPIHCFKGFAGGIRNIYVHHEYPLVFSVSLDRFLRVHHLHSSRLLFDEYLKSRLNCLLVKDDIDIADFTPLLKKKKNKRKKEKENEEEDVVDIDTVIKPSKSKIIRPDSDWAALTV